MGARNLGVCDVTMETSPDTNEVSVRDVLTLDVIDLFPDQQPQPRRHNRGMKNEIDTKKKKKAQASKDPVPFLVRALESIVRTAQGPSERSDVLLPWDEVLIENQIGTVNSRMKCLQASARTFFFCLSPGTPVSYVWPRGKSDASDRILRGAGGRGTVTDDALIGARSSNGAPIGDGEPASGAPSPPPPPRHLQQDDEPQGSSDDGRLRRCSPDCDDNTPSVCPSEGEGAPSSKPGAGAKARRKQQHCVSYRDRKRTCVEAAGEILRRAGIEDGALARLRKADDAADALMQAFYHHEKNTTSRKRSLALAGAGAGVEAKAGS